MSDDYNIGDSNVDINESLDGDMIEFEYENKVIFERLADDIYESGEAGIREPLQNAITAVKKAKRQGYIEDGIIDIEIRENNSSRTVKIQDNGIGISKQVLNEVLSVVGRSANRRDGDLSGKFGMGFLAFYKLVGTDGGFTMHTRSRDTDDYIKGIWKPGGFENDTEDKLPTKLSDDVYGTLFTFSTDAHRNEIVSWVEKHSEWSSVPIRLTVYDNQDKQIVDEEYGCKSISDTYEDSVTIKNDFYEVTATPDTYTYNNTVLLMNTPINSDSNIGYLSTLKIKREDGIIISGPNKGKIPVSKNEYEQVENPEDYVVEDNLYSDDIRLPEPTGTRESLKNEDKFFNYVENLIEDKFKDRIKNLATKMQEDIKQLSIDEYVEIKKLSNTIYSYQSKMYDDMNIDSKYRTLFERFKYSTEIRKPKSNEQPRLYTDKLYNIIKEVDNIENIFAFKTYNKNKGYILDDQLDDYVILKLDGSSPSNQGYDDVTEFGIRKFKRIKKITNYNDDLESELKPDDTTTNIRYVKERGNNKVKTKKNKVSNIVENDAFDKLILFHKSKGKNITDYDHILSNDIWSTNVDKDSFEYLKDKEDIVSIDKFIDSQKDKKFKTSDGELTTSEILKYDGNVMVHESDFYEKSCNKAEKTEQILHEYIHEDIDYNILLSSNRIQDDILYVPVTDESEIKTALYTVSGRTRGITSIDYLDESSYIIHDLNLNETVHESVVDIVPKNCTDENKISKLANNITTSNRDKRKHTYTTEIGDMRIDDILSFDNILLHAVPHHMKDIFVENRIDSKNEVSKYVNVEPDVYVIIDEGDYELIKKELSSKDESLRSDIKIVLSERFNNTVRGYYRNNTVDSVELYRDMVLGEEFEGFNFTNIEQIEKIDNL